MRTIKFRGKCRDDGEWVYGYLTKADAHDHAVILEKDPVAPQYLLACDVDTDTVGQYTGLKDSNGIEVYEGDVISVNGQYEKLIAYQEGCAAFCAANVSELNFEYGNPWHYIYPEWWSDEGRTILVIGNIHDNPELMKGADDDK